MDISRKRILVTGGSGVIGRYLTHLLEAKGSVVHVFDKIGKSNDFSPSGGYTRINMAKGTYEKVISKFEPDVIFHLAATFERSEESSGFWGQNFQDNVCLTHRLLSALSKMEIDIRLVFGSSYLIYDPALFLRANPTEPAFGLKENSPVNPRNLCGAAKYYNEREILFISGKFPGISSVSARIFRVYGEGSRDVISRWIRNAITDKPLTVFHKENQFDYIFAEDVAEALIRLSVSNARNSVVNVGRGIPIAISKVVDTISSHFPDIDIRETDCGGAFEKSHADIGLLKKLTNWRPNISVEDGIDRIVNYEKRRKRIDDDHAT